MSLINSEYACTYKPNNEKIRTKLRSSSRPVARLFKRGVHMCMGLITMMYSQQGLEYFLLAFMHVLVTTAY